MVMKKTIFFCIPALLLMAYHPGDLKPPQVKKIKAAELRDYIAGSRHPLIVSFWATFCEPCNKEIPYLQRIADEHKQDGVELLLVSLDLPSYYPGRISDFAGRKDYHCQLAWLDETNADYFCPLVDTKWSGGIPASLFINNHTHYRQFFDRQLTEPQVALAIRDLVKGERP
jgi:thiol-disulfide isomerase/thioredoxin